MSHGIQGEGGYYRRHIHTLTGEEGRGERVGEADLGVWGRVARQQQRDKTIAQLITMACLSHCSEVSIGSSTKI